MTALNGSGQTIRLSPDPQAGKEGRDDYENSAGEYEEYDEVAGEEQDYQDEEDEEYDEEED